MELRARIPTLRRAAMMAALVALAAPATAGAAPTAHAAKTAKKKVKAPVITSVRPMDVAVGEWLVIRGRNFRAGRRKNTVVFKRDGARAVFAKAEYGTRKLIKIKVPSSVQEFMTPRAGAPAPTRFRVRVLARKFGKAFTVRSLSPVISPPRPSKAQPPAAVLPDGDCDGDGAKNSTDGDDDNDGLTDVVERSLGLDPCVVDSDGDGLVDKWEFDCDRDAVLNRDETDDDDDLLSDALETAIGTDPCSKDTDGDRVEDGYEYQSAKDLNDDEHGDPNSYLPYPGKRPYPNPLFADANVDFDGDSLTLVEEYDLWVYTYSVTRTDARTLAPLSYSDGEQYSRSHRVDAGAQVGRREPTLSRVGYDKHEQFLSWASTNGYRVVMLDDGAPWWAHGLTRNPYGLFDFNRDGFESPSPSGGAWRSEVYYFDFDGDGYLSDDERDEDADGLTNFDETHGRMLPAYWQTCYAVEKPFHLNYAGTSHVDADSDGDGVLDGADDQDHDDIPNVMELSRNAASGLDDTDPVKGTCVQRESPALPTPLHHPSAYGRVNPFNPCLPAVWSRTCPSHYNNETGAPFDGSPNWYALN
jgi:hypothetical protein